MTWTDPTDPTAGVTSLTAAREKTNILDNLRAIAEWTTYSPTVTQSGTVTKTDTYSKYKSYGGTIEIIGFLTMTGAGTIGNTITVSLPSGIQFVTATELTIGTARITDISVPSTWPALVQIASTTTFKFIRSDNASPTNYVGVDPSFGLASGDLLTYRLSAERN